MADTPEIAQKAPYAVDVEAGTPISIFSLVDGMEVLVQSTTLPATASSATSTSFSRKCRVTLVSRVPNTNE